MEFAHDTDCHLNVKLLRLCVDYGEDRILAIRHSIPDGIVPTVDMVRSQLHEAPGQILFTSMAAMWMSSPQTCAGSMRNAGWPDGWINKTDH